MRARKITEAAIPIYIQCVFVRTTMFADNNKIIIPKSYGDLQTTRHPFRNDVTARPTGCFRETERGKKDLTSQGVSFGGTRKARG